jgi:alpha-beta hydrolase superfamily lysophospholipase
MADATVQELRTSSGPGAGDVPHAAGTDAPVYIHTRGGVVFGFLHRARGAAGGTAVLLCPPFGWEDMCCYRIRREWAQRLCERGLTTLRIDLPGSGDSAGDPRDSDQLGRWTSAVADSASWLRVDSGASSLTAIGIGLGGLLACRATLAGAPIDEVAAWAAPAQGRRLVRELRTFSAHELARESAPETHAAGAPAGSLAVNGYVLSEATVAALESLDLAAEVDRADGPSPGERALRRALLLGRDGIRTDARLAAALSDAGAEVTETDGPGFAAMMVEPQDARAPVEVFQIVERWIEQGEEAGDEHEPAAADEPQQPRRLRELRLGEAGSEVREHAMWIERAGAEPLFGVLTEPVGPRRALTAVLMNAGPQRRTGPNRMWVEVARRWAARGVSTLRFDAAGIGDSDGDASVLARNAEFYKPEYVEQARAALDELARRGLPQRYVLAGLCAGAYWSAHAAIADTRVAAVMMLNPRTLVFDERAHTARRVRQLRERALLPSTWRRALSGELHLARHLETASSLAALAARAPRRGGRGAGPAAHAGEPATPPASVEELFDGLRERGQRGLLLFTGAEVLHHELTARGALGDMSRWPNLELAVRGTDGDTHTLSPVWLQHEVHALLDDALSSELSLLGED